MYIPTKNISKRAIIKYIKFILLLLFIHIPLFTFSQENNINDDIDSLAISKIEDSANDLNLKYSDFMIIIPNYSLIGVNFDNYIDYNQTEPGDIFPFIDYGTDYDIHIADQDHYYFFPTTDTLTLYQDITTESIFEKTIKLIPLNKERNVSYKISIALDESIQQRYIQGIENSDDEYEMNLETWRGITPYKQLKTTKKLEFKVPKESEVENLKDLKRKLSLQDCNIFYESELSQTATVIYKGRPSVFTVEGAILKIEKLKDKKTVEIYYIYINIAYGC